jgi:hypothetical protein
MVHNSDSESDSSDDDLMADEDAEAEAFAEKLESEGHTCVEILESYPCQVSWCEKTPCANVVKEKLGT